MLIALILVLLLVWSAVIWSIYSNFLVFYSNFRETENYHKAYYASISALERWELVTKQHEPWYVGSGGFKSWIWTWSVGNTTWSSDGSLSDFSYFWTNSWESTVFWTVNSRTKRIPAIWEWDVEEMFVTWDVKNYNMMDYENAEVFLLYYDDSKQPYEKPGILDILKTFDSITVVGLTWIIRLPQAITGRFWVDLDEDTSLVGLSGSLPKNDAIVDWQVRWSLWGSFTVYSTQSLEYNWNWTKVNEKEDSVFREWDINSPLKFRFWGSRNPFNIMGVSRGSDVNPTIISRNEDDVRSKRSFSRLFYQANTPQLRFSLLNLLESREDVYGKKHIYPFLEYYVDFGSRYASNVYYKIEAEWNYKDYQVDNIIYKPTVKDTILWSFTSIF